MDEPQLWPPHDVDWHRPIQVRYSLRLPRGNILTRPSRPYGFEVPYEELFRGFEDIVIRHGGRPHWAKAHNMRPDDLRALYPRFDDFVRVLDEVDPQGMFRNEYVQRHIYGQQGDTAEKYKK